MAHRADGLNDIFEHSVSVRESLNANSGTIAKVPATDKDIANKKYVDDSISAIGTVLTTKGGTGLTSYSQGDLIYYNSGTALSRLPKTSTATLYLSNQGTSNNPSWGYVNLGNGVTGTLPVGSGGTNKTSWTANCLVYTNGATSFANLGQGTAGKILREQGSGFGATWTTCTYPTTVTNGAFLGGTSTNVVGEITGVSYSSGSFTSQNLKAQGSNVNPYLWIQDTHSSGYDNYSNAIVVADGNSGCLYFYPKYNGKRLLSLGDSNYPTKLYMPGFSIENENYNSMVIKTNDTTRLKVFTDGHIRVYNNFEVGITVDEPTVTATITYANIGDSSNLGASQNNYEGAPFFANGASYNFSVYAYKNTPHGKKYSTNASSVNFTDNADFSSYYDVSLSWDSVTGADGYAIINTDNSTGADVATNSANYTGTWSYYSGPSSDPDLFTADNTSRTYEVYSYGDGYYSITSDSDTATDDNSGNPYFITLTLTIGTGGESNRVINSGNYFDTSSLTVYITPATSWTASESHTPSCSGLGINGTFTSADSPAKTITVRGGIITSIV